MENCVFCKIRDKKITTEFVYKDEDVMVIRDLHPVKPIHLLIIPTTHVKEFMAIQEVTLFEKVGRVIQQMIKEQGLETKGYRIKINGGGFQEVDHLHIHLMGPMGLPNS